MSGLVVLRWFHGLFDSSPPLLLSLSLEMGENHHPFESMRKRTVDRDWLCFSVDWIGSKVDPTISEVDD